MQGHHVYKTNDIETASSIKLVVMLYGGAVRFTQLAIDAINQKNYEKANENIIKTQNIVGELLSSLNFEAGEISNTLSQLYLYIHRRLLEANLQKKSDILQEVSEILQNLKSAWDELLNKEENNTLEIKNINISG